MGRRGRKITKKSTAKEEEPAEIPYSKYRALATNVGVGALIFVSCTFVGSQSRQLSQYATTDSLTTVLGGASSAVWGQRVGDGTKDSSNKDTTSSSGSTPNTYEGYIPAPFEAYIMNNTEKLKLEAQNPALTPTCYLWTDPQSTPYYNQVVDYMHELDVYTKMVKSFQIANVTDLRKNVTSDNHDICEQLKLHPDGLPGIFVKSQQLSYTRAGWVEPLYPSMRHPKYCLEPTNNDFLMDTSYIIHDFHALCKSLKPNSRTIFIDMGAALNFHAGQQSPTFDILDIFKRFGFHFDHVYAWELRAKDVNQVFDAVPQYLETSFHWINTGVSSEKASKHNPWRLLLENYHPDDLVIVKLDIDAPQLERELADQLENSTQLASLIDHFYFEHHVNQEELFRHWRGTTESVLDSLKLFSTLRKHGMAAHYWV